MPAAGARASASSRGTQRALTGAALVVALNQTAIYPALPVIQGEYGADASGTAWLVTGFLVIAAVSTPVVGRLGDVRGRGRALVWTLVASGLGSLVSAVAWTLPVLVAGRALQGAGFAAFALAAGLVRELLPPELVADGIARLSAMYAVGAASGLVTTGLLIDLWGVASIFWVQAGAAAMATVGVVLRVPRRRPGTADVPVDWCGAALLVLTLATFLLGVGQAGREGQTVVALALLGASVVAGVAWAMSALRSTAPIVDVRLCLSPPVGYVYVVAFTAGFAVFAAYFVVPLVVQAPEAGFGAGATASGLYLLPASIVMIVLSPLAGRIDARYGSRMTLLLGGAGALAAYLWLAAAHDEPYSVIVGSALLGIGLGWLFSATVTLALELSPVERAGVAAALAIVVRSVGGAVGVQATAVLLDAVAAPDGSPTERGFVLAFLLCAAGAVAGIAVTTRIRALA